MRWNAMQFNGRREAGRKEERTDLGLWAAPLGESAIEVFNCIQFFGHRRSSNEWKAKARVGFEARATFCLGSSILHFESARLIDSNAKESSLSSLAKRATGAGAPAAHPKWLNRRAQRERERGRDKRSETPSWWLSKTTQRLRVPLAASHRQRVVWINKGNHYFCVQWQAGGVAWNRNRRRRCAPIYCQANEWIESTWAQIGREMRSRGRGGLFSTNRIISFTFPIEFPLVGILAFAWVDPLFHCSATHTDRGTLWTQAAWIQDLA